MHLLDGIAMMVLGQGVSAPLATRRLADLGARAIGLGGARERATSPAGTPGQGSGCPPIVSG